MGCALSGRKHRAPSPIPTGPGELAAKTELHRDHVSSLLLSGSAGAQNEQHSRDVHRKDMQCNTGPSSQQEVRLLVYTAK